MTSRAAAFLIALVVVAGIVGFFVGHEMAPVRIVEREISPSSVDDPLGFYVDYLRSLNYTVTEKELRTNEYKTVESFNQLLWILKTTSMTECFVDNSKEYSKGFLDFNFVRKLWVQYDGVYLELRFERFDS